MDVYIYINILFFGVIFKLHLPSQVEHAPLGVLRGGGSLTAQAPFREGLEPDPETEQLSK